MWASHPEFHQLVHQIWDNNSSLMETTKNFQEVASQWNQHTFGSIFHRKRKILARLVGIQSSIHYPTSIFLQNLETQLTNDFSSILRLGEDFWKLKSRLFWLNEGDANTNFFHMSTLHRRRKNRITSLKDSVGNWSLDQSEIQHQILTYYKNLFTTEQTQSLKIHDDSNL